MQAVFGITKELRNRDQILGGLSVGSSETLGFFGCRKFSRDSSGFIAATSILKGPTSFSFNVSQPRGKDRFTSSIRKTYESSRPGSSLLQPQIARIRTLNTM